VKDTLKQLLRFRLNHKVKKRSHSDILKTSKAFQGVYWVMIIYNLLPRNY
jgi:hypothetical protein